MLRNWYPMKLTAISIDVSLNHLSANVALCEEAGEKPGDLHRNS